MAVNEGIELKVYDGVTNPKTYLDTLHNREQPKYLEQLGATGSGSMVINYTDPQTIETPSLLDYRNVVKVVIDGKVTGAFIISQKDETSVADAEGSAESRSITGPGLMSWFEEAVVMPMLGLSQFASGKRYFNFSTYRDTWYDASKWTKPRVTGKWGDTPFGPRPDNWPDDHAARWVWNGSYSQGGSIPNAVNLFRLEFNTGDEGGTWTFWGGGDDYVEMWLDGAKIIDTDFSKSSIDQGTKVEVVMQAGNHVLAARVTNGGSSPVNNPGALMAAVYHNIGTSLPLRYATGDNNNWVGYYLGTTIPTPVWTPGEIVLKLIDEAKARGVRSMGWITPTFSATTDSNGQPWLTTSDDWEFNVGDTILKVIQTIQDTLGYYAWIDPDTYAFNIGQYKGVDRSVDPDAIVFEIGKNLRKADSAGVGKVRNSLATKTADGWLIDPSTKDNDSIAKYGTIEALYSSDISQEAAKSIMKPLFKQYATVEEGATYEISSLDEIPWEDYNVGDLTLAPNSQGLRVPRQVVSISVEESSTTGMPLYTLEFDVVFQTNEQRLGLIIGNITGGGIGNSMASGGGSGSSLTNPQLPPAITQPPASPMPPANLTATSDGAWTANGVTPISTVHLSWDPVTLNTQGTEIIPQYYEVWGTKASEPEGIHSLLIVTGTTADITPLVPNETWVFQVRTLMDVNGPYSVFSSSIAYAGEGPSDPLPAPSKPSLSSSNGLLNVAWDGLLNGAQPAPQFRYVYAQIASSSEGPWQIAGQALQRGGGDMNIPGLTVGQEYWVRLIAVDGLTIVSQPSEVDSLTINGVDLGDLPEQLEASVEAVRQAVSDVRENVNMLEDSSFELNTQDYWDWNEANVTNVTTMPRTGLRHLRAAAASAPYEIMHYVRPLECDPGQSFYLRVYVRVQSGTSLEGGLTMNILYGETEDTTDGKVDIGLSTVFDTNYALIEGNWTAPDGALYFRPSLTMVDTSNRVYYIDDVRMFVMDDNTTIVDGAINADKLAAESVIAGKVAANAISTENLQAGSIVAELIAVGAITAEKILAGSITTDKVAAGAITTNLLSPTVGNDLDISANNTVTIIAGQLQDVDDSANATNDNLQQMQTYYAFGPDGATVSTPSSPFAVSIQNDSIDMLENGNVVSYWNSGTLYVDQFQGTKVILGNHQLEKYNTGTVVRAI